LLGQIGDGNPKLVERSSGDPCAARATRRHRAGGGFLATDGAGYIIGQTLSVSGGLNSLSGLLDDEILPGQSPRGAPVPSSGGTSLTSIEADVVGLVDLGRE
jgi:hypothetical protein